MAIVKPVNLGFLDCKSIDSRTSAFEREEEEAQLFASEELQLFKHPTFDIPAVANVCSICKPLQVFETHPLILYVPH
jgi:hypothetical protein